MHFDTLSPAHIGCWEGRAPSLWAACIAILMIYKKKSLMPRIAPL